MPNNNGVYQGGNGVYQPGNPVYDTPSAIPLGNAGEQEYTWNPQSDFWVFDDPETLDYTSHATNYPGDLVLGGLYPCYRFEMSFKEMAGSQGVYTTRDRKFVVPRQLVANQPLKPADFFIDKENVEWTVLSTDYNVEQAYWDLTCRNLTLEHQLYDLITIQTCTNAVDPSGTRVPTFTNTYVNLPARIQEIEGSSLDERGKRLTARRYTIYLGRRVVVTQEDLVQDVAGNTYAITGYQKPDLITDLMELSVVRKGW